MNPNADTRQVLFEKIDYSLIKKWMDIGLLDEISEQNKYKLSKTYEELCVFLCLHQNNSNPMYEITIFPIIYRIFKQEIPINIEHIWQDLHSEENIKLLGACTELCCANIDGEAEFACLFVENYVKKFKDNG
jgi:hypothetical protein